MKLSREYGSEAEAQAREENLRAQGVPAWRAWKPDGMWQVFWVVADEPLVSVSTLAA